jgi:hypothetical protein
MLTYVTAWEKLNSTNASPPEIGHDGNSVAGEHYRNSAMHTLTSFCFLTLFLSLKHPFPLEAQQLFQQQEQQVAAAAAAAPAPAAAAAAAAAATRTRAAPPHQHQQGGGEI